MYHEIGFKYTCRPPREIGKPQAHHASRRQEGIEAASAEYITGRTDGRTAFALSEATLEVDGREGRKDQDEKWKTYMTSSFDFPI